jgi:hypothetical protein
LRGCRDWGWVSWRAEWRRNCGSGLVFRRRNWSPDYSFLSVNIR